MSQAEKEFNEAEAVLEQLGVDESTASRLNPLIENAPSETLQGCADVVDFVGTACDAIEHNGGADFGGAACRLLMTVSAALKYEAVRAGTLYKRNAAKVAGGAQ